MLAGRLRVLLILAAVACSTRSPGPGEHARRAPDVVLPENNPDLPPPDPREAKLSATVRLLLEKQHLRGKQIDDAVSRAAFAIYVKRLDAGKMFLLKSDAASLERHADRIDDQLRGGSLELAHDGAKLFVGRVVVVEKLVAELLSKPLDFSDEEFIEVDPDKLELAASEQELRERWRRRLELEVLERVTQMEEQLARKQAGAKPDEEDDAPAIPLAQIPTTPEAREAKARGDVAKAYAGRFTRQRNPGPLDAASDLVNAVAATFDPHTNYLPPADKANFDIAMSGKLEGIGAVLRERDHYIEVVELVPGGASWRQGRLEPGDLILSVTTKNGEAVDVLDMKIDDVVKMIRGPKGTVVTLRVQKPTGDEETIAITRDEVVIEEAYARGAVVTPNKAKQSFGYIYLPSFYGGQGSGQRTAAGDVRRLLAEMKKRRVTGVVIDLRSNGGGFLGDAVEMTGLLVDQGPVVQIRDSGGQRELLSDTERGTGFDGPVVVMVDRFSASASEIVAGALQDYQRAVIIGTGPTHGKGTVQALADLDRAGGGQVELGVLKITVQQFFRVSGASTQREGVTPDVVLPDPAGHVDAGERELENAIPWSQIDPADHRDWAPTWKTKTLVTRSAARMTKHPTFAKVIARADLLRARKDDTRLPLQRKAWDDRRAKQKAALDATSPDLDKGPARFTVKLLDEHAVAPRPGPGGKPDDRIAKWRDGVSRDPWIEESLYVLADMANGRATK